jgi:hypothetical protein
VRRTFKILALVIGLTAMVALGILGFAIWVFIPILPAGIIVTLAIMSTRRRQARQVEEEEITEQPKAA